MVLECSNKELSLNNSCPTKEVGLMSLIAQDCSIQVQWTCSHSQTAFCVWPEKAEQLSRALKLYAESIQQPLADNVLSSVIKLHYYKYRPIWKNRFLWKLRMKKRSIEVFTFKRFYNGSIDCRPVKSKVGPTQEAILGLSTCIEYLN